MNLYLISQAVNDGYDTYDAAVVAAETEEDARSIHPSPRIGVTPEGDGQFDGEFREWTCRGNVAVRLIGVAAEGTERGVVLASFNAG